MYIDTVFSGDVLNSTKIGTIVIGPAASTPTGQPKYTLNNVILTKTSIKMDQTGLVMEHGEGEALTITVGTW